VRCANHILIFVRIVNLAFSEEEEGLKTFGAIGARASFWNKRGDRLGWAGGSWVGRRLGDSASFLSIPSKGASLLLHTQFDLMSLRIHGVFTWLFGNVLLACRALSYTNYRSFIAICWL